MGGIGNQFFQYFAGVWLAKRLGVKHRVIAILAQNGRTGHSDWMDAFDFHADSVITGDVDGSLRMLIYRWKKRALEFVRKFNPTHPVYKFIIGGFYWSCEVGYDKDLLAVNKPVVLEGLFQTYRYAADLQRQGVDTRLQLKQPSDWHQSMVAEMAGKRVLALHVRRGDYMALAEKHGLLSEDYYIRAIRLLEAAGHTWDSLLVFSDSPDLIAEQFRGLAKYSPRYIAQPPGTHSAESLDLMARAQHIVIANSTFSWWAAFFASGATIVRPSKWFPSMEDPKDLCPPEWLVCETSWEPLGK